MCLLKISIAIWLMSGCAIQVPSWPLVTSRSLSARTLAIATSLACGSFLIGICADIPPIAATLRLYACNEYMRTLLDEITLPVAGLDEETDVSVHEADLHRDVLAIRKDGTPVSTTPLDEAEDVIPTVNERQLSCVSHPSCAYSPTAVQASGVRPELEQDFLHLERRRECLDEDRGADGAVRHADVRLREVEDVVPETSLEVVLHLREVEVRPEPALDELVRVVEEIKREVEQRPRDRRVVDGNAGLIQMPSTRTAQIGGESAKRVREHSSTACMYAYRTIRTAGFSESLYGLPPDSKSIWRRIASRRLTWPWIMFANVGEHASFHNHHPSALLSSHPSSQTSSKTRTFKVSHKRLRAAVERVDDHLALRGAGDLDAPVLEAGAGRGTEPGGVGADVLGLSREVERLAGIEALLCGLAGDEEALAGGLEGPVEGSDELECVLGEDLRLRILCLGRVDLDALDHGGSTRMYGVVWGGVDERGRVAIGVGPSGGHISSGGSPRHRTRRL